MPDLHKDFLNKNTKNIKHKGSSLKLESSIREAEAEGSQVEASLGYIVRQIFHETLS
jgi:hypothetical protein